MRIWKSINKYYINRRQSTSHVHHLYYIVLYIRVLYKLSNKNAVNLLSICTGLGKTNQQNLHLPFTKCIHLAKTLLHVHKKTQSPKNYAPITVSCSNYRRRSRRIVLVGTHKRSQHADRADIYDTRPKRPYVTSRSSKEYIVSTQVLRLASLLD